MTDIRRSVISIDEARPQDPAVTPPYGWVVSLSCGHRFWASQRLLSLGNITHCHECSDRESALRAVGAEVRNG